MAFEQLGVSKPILKALAYEGYERPTPIQEQAIPVLLEGRDLLGCAQTGTGKTAAFGIPIIQLLSEQPQEKHDNKRDRHRRRPIRALVITPTRELALQIGESFTKYAHHTPIRNTVIFGGVKQGVQTRALSRGVDVLVATPGRLLDLMNQGFVSLDKVEFFVLDEADHMLDMGFIHDIKKVVQKLPERRQSLFFSATMPAEIVKLSKSILGNPHRITIKPDQTTAERVEQQIYFVSKANKRSLLVHLLETTSFYSVLVFSRTKHGADKITRVLNKAGIKADAIHGNKTQNARQRTLNKFKDGKTHVLVATDIAARGIDVDNLSHVINYDLPNVPETYVHRIGRTGRAQASGIAISFCQADERPYLKDIQKLIKQEIEVVEEHPYVQEASDLPKSKPKSKSGGGGGSRGKSKKSSSGSKDRPARRKSSDRSNDDRPKDRGDRGEKAPRTDRSSERSSDKRTPSRERGGFSRGKSDRKPAGGRRRENHFPYLKELDGWESFESPGQSADTASKPKKKKTGSEKKKLAKRRDRKNRPRNNGASQQAGNKPAKKAHRKNSPSKDKGKKPEDN